MFDQHTSSVDPFSRREGRVAAIGARLGISEGQLYSMAIGLLLVWMVSANGLPTVVWDSADLVAAPRSTAGAPSAGLIDEAPSPRVPPVTAPSVAFDAAPSAPLPAGEPASDPFLTFDESDEDLGPLRVESGGYASAAAGTPLATLGVPEGSVAVARRGGQPFNIAYLRVAGSPGSLDLAVDADAANALDAVAGLVVCPVTEEGWHVGHGDVDLDDAPTYDCAAAIPGTRADDGTSWTFDLAGLDLESLSGIALVPDATAPAPEFQVVFRISG